MTMVQSPPREPRPNGQWASDQPIGSNHGQLDTSYQQTELRATNGRSGVSSKLRAKDIPKGIQVYAHGKSDETYEQGWDVSDPELQEVKNATGEVVRYKFGMRLFCKVGTTGAIRNSANVPSKQKSATSHSNEIAES